MLSFLPRMRVTIVVLSMCLAGCAGAPPIPDTPPRFDRSASSNTFPEDEYPIASRRLWEEGTTIIAILVLEDGSAGKTQLVESSGFPRLDDAALNWYSHNGKFLPGTKNGKPIAAWKTIKVRFNLRRPE